MYWTGFIYPELKILKLSWGCVAIALASWKSGKLKVNTCIITQRPHIGVLWFHNRSLVIIGPDDNTATACKNLLKILELLVDEGFLKNNCELVMSSADCVVAQFEGRTLGSRYLQVIYSMNNLEKLVILEYDMTVADLAHLFQSCPNIIHLHLKLFRHDILESKNDLSQNQLRLGFQKLQHLKIVGDCYSENLFLELFPYA